MYPIALPLSQRKYFRMKFVSLSREQLSELDAVMRSKGCDKRTFKRLQSIKLNATGYSILGMVQCWVTLIYTREPLRTTKTVIYDKWRYFNVLPGVTLI